MTGISQTDPAPVRTVGTVRALPHGSHSEEIVISDGWTPRSLRVGPLCLGTIFLAVVVATKFLLEYSSGRR